MNRVLVVGRGQLSTAVTDRIAAEPDMTVEAPVADTTDEPPAEITAGRLASRVDCVVIPVGPPSVDRLGYLGQIRASYETIPVAVVVDGLDVPLSEQNSSATAVFPLDGTESALVPWIRRRVARNATDTATTDTATTDTAATDTATTDTAITETDVRGEDEQFLPLVEHTPTMIAVLDATGRYRYVNASVRRVLGYDPEELLGQLAFDRIHVADRQRIREEFATTIDNGDGLHTVEYRYRHADGVWQVVRSWWKNGLDDPDIGGIVVTSRDVTRLKMVETFADGMYAFDENLRVVAVNESALEMTGYSREEALCSHVSRFLDDVNQQKAAQTRERLVASDRSVTTVELAIRRKDGTTFPAEVRFSLLDSTADEYSGSVGVIRDITDRKEGTRELMSLYRGS